LAGPPLDRLLDRVERHRGGPGLLEGSAQRGVGVEVAPALTRRHLDGADALGEDFGACLVLGALAILGGRPLRVTRHTFLPRFFLSQRGWPAGPLPGLRPRWADPRVYPWAHRTKSWPAPPDQPAAAEESCRTPCVGPAVRAATGGALVRVKVRLTPVSTTRR